MGPRTISRRATVTALASIVSFGVAAGVVSACGDDRNAFDTAPPPFQAPDASVDAPEACGFACSPDLKRVLRACPGKPPEELEVCGPGLGCGVDKCVDACEAASLSKGSTGCAFATLPPDDAKNGPGSCFAAIVANTWDRPVAIRAEWGSDKLDISGATYTIAGTSSAPEYRPLAGPLPPGELAVVFLARTDNPIDVATATCPPGTRPAVAKDPIRHGTAKTRAFRIFTDAPVSAYSIFPYGGAPTFFPSAALLLPEASWDTSYVSVVPARVGVADEAAQQPRTVQIVAREDGTEVSLRPTVDIAPGADVPSIGAGRTGSVVLGRGEVLQITQPGLPSGSPIVGSKPFGLFGGSPAISFPVENCCADVTQQQVEPYAQWGSSYALVPYASRVSGIGGPTPERVYWSVTGAVDGTELTYEPSRPAGAPARLGAGESIAFVMQGVGSVRSQDAAHPFHVALHMTSSFFGGGAQGGGRTLGDPDFVGVVPSDQFLDRYVFFADHSFPETSLTIVRRKTSTGFKDVVLACAGSSSVVDGFQPVDGRGDLELAWVRLTSGGLPQRVGGGVCGYGRLGATSEGTFSVLVAGTGKDASYSYSAGRGSRPINQAPPLRVR